MKAQILLYTMQTNCCHYRNRITALEIHSLYSNATVVLEMSIHLYHKLKLYNVQEFEHSKQELLTIHYVIKKVGISKET